MNVELTIAGLSCFALAFGHTAIGFRWIVPNLTKESLPSTPFGPPSLTLGMVRFTWHIVSVLLVAFGVLLLTLAGATEMNPRMLVLRWFRGAVAWCYCDRLLGGPPPPAQPPAFSASHRFVLIAVLCWKVSV
jgi:hypothetical protein